MLMASQVTPSSQAVPANKQTLLTKSLQVRTTSTGQCSPQTQGINMATLSQQQVRFPSFFLIEIHVTFVF